MRGFFLQIAAPASVSVGLFPAQLCAVFDGCGWRLLLGGPGLVASRSISIPNVLVTIVITSVSM